MSRKKIIRLLLLVLLPVLFIITACNIIISRYARDKLYNDVNSIPENKCGLMLGTSKYISKGKPNPYFTARVQAAAALYRAGKIRYLIISGDNRHVSYNEPREMRRALVAEGIPDSILYSDYAGFRTFDSMVRAKEIFGQTRITIITQPFHNMRAVFIAKHFGIEAIGFNAADVSTARGLKTQFREVFARTKVFLDIYILKTKPKFLGEKIDIPE
jgi:SanA protein